MEIIFEIIVSEGSSVTSSTALISIEALVLPLSIFIEALKGDGINLIGKDLIGFDVVLNSGDYVGTLKDVMWLPSNDAYIIKNKNKEYLIPVIPEVVKSLNYETEVIVITPMDGLLD